MLAACTEDHPFDWEQYLPKVCMGYNTSIQSSTGFSSFYLMFGRQAKLLIDLIHGTGNQEGESQSVGEYVASLKTKISTEFDIVRKKCI